MLVLARAQADDARDAVDFQIERPRAVGNDQVLGFAVVDVNGVGSFGKQIDGRRAVERDVALIDGMGDAGLGTIEEQNEVDFGAGAATHRRADVRRG